MKKPSKRTSDPDMLEEYDFNQGVRGKYAKRYAAGTNVVLLEPDVAAVFPNSESVNEALRVLAKLIALGIGRSRKTASTSRPRVRKAAS